MIRKIIQISTGYKHSYGTSEIPSITALCDDGTVWTLIQCRQAGWEKVIDIPQDNEDGSKKDGRDDIGKF